MERAARSVVHQKETLEETAEKTLEDAENTLTNIAGKDSVDKHAQDGCGSHYIGHDLLLIL